MAIKLEDLSLVDELKEEKLYQRSSKCWLESLKKATNSKKLLRKKVHTHYFSIFAARNFLRPANKSNLLISFVMKRKLEMQSKKQK